MTTVTIHGDLHGKGRPRFANGHAYTPETTRRYEGKIQAAWVLAHGKRIDGPVAVHITAYQTLPKRASKALREAVAAGKAWPLRKPDVDNVIKIVLDALNGYAYNDDTQVVRLYADKMYTICEECYLTVTVWSMTPTYGKSKPAMTVKESER